MTFTNQDYSNHSGFKGPYVCWAVLWICGLKIITRIIVWLPCEHSETRAPKISRFINWTKTTPMFLELFSTISSMRGEIYEQEVNLDNLLRFHGNTCSRYPSQGTQEMLTQDKETKKVWTLQPKPSHTRGAEHEEQLEEQHRQGAGVQPYPVIT